MKKNVLRNKIDLAETTNVSCLVPVPTAVRTKRNELFFGESASYDVSASRKRLSCQTERFLSVADKLYPAWQVRMCNERAVNVFARG